MCALVANRLQSVFFAVLVAFTAIIVACNSSVHSSTGSFIKGDWVLSYVGSPMEFVELVCVFVDYIEDVGMG